jgi:hypothetical protein
MATGTCRGSHVTRHQPERRGPVRRGPRRDRVVCPLPGRRLGRRRTPRHSVSSCDHKTIAAGRSEKEASGEIPQLKKRSALLGRLGPARKAKRATAPAAPTAAGSGRGLSRGVENSAPASASAGTRLDRGEHSAGPCGRHLAAYRGHGEGSLWGATALRFYRTSLGCTFGRESGYLPPSCRLPLPPE